MASLQCFFTLYVCNAFLTFADDFLGVFFLALLQVTGKQNAIEEHKHSI